MQTVTGLYDNHEDAKTAVSALEDAGISSSNISIVGRSGKTDESNAGEGAATGAAGGIIGSMTSAGVDENDAHIYAEGVRRGGTLVSARVEDDQVDIARSVIDDNAPVDLNTRRAMYREEGWQGFDENSADFTEEELVRERERARDYRPMA